METAWIPVTFTRSLRIGWNWDDLLQDATTAPENMNLAVAGLVLSRNAEISSLIVETTLRQLGFGGIRSEYYLLTTKTRNQISDPARTFGHKVVEKDGKQYHVICAVFKGTTTLPDVITDIKSVGDGFYLGGCRCAQSLKEYIGSIEGADRDNTILFITGHSLGASTANVVGRLCGELAKDEAKFVYTFASPNYETEGEADDGKAYPNFRYFTNMDDIVPTVPPRIPPKYFSKIGVEHLYSFYTLEEEQKERFLLLYQYFRRIPFEDDNNLLGTGLREGESLGYKALKNHLCHTYMSFLLSGVQDEELEKYLVES